MKTRLPKWAALFFKSEFGRNYVEREHLFSVSSGTRTAAAILGSALAGLVPLLLASDEHGIAGSLRFRDGNTRPW